MQETYYLYHHMPHPLAAEEVRAQCWLHNNALSYSVVAVLEARSHDEAFRAIRGQKGHHGVTVRQGNIIRETLPGDVLVGRKEAWMLMTDGVVQSIFPQLTTPYKSYAHDGTSVYTLSWSPDGNYLAAGNSRGDILIHSLSNANERQATSYDRHRPSSVRALSWSADGMHIASSADYHGEVHVWAVAPQGGYRDAAVGSILLCRSNEGDHWRQQVERLLWLDNYHILAGRESGWMVVWNTLNGERLFVTNRHQEAITDLARSPDGTHIASASRDRTIRVWKSSSIPEQDIVLSHRAAVLTLDWSPDATRLASCEEGQQTVLLWNAKDGYLLEQIPLSVFSTRSAHVNTLRWSPDGKQIAIGSDEGWVQILDMDSRRHCATYQSGSQAIHALAWSPDGNYLATTGGMWRQAVEIWRTSDKQYDQYAEHGEATKKEEK